MTKVLKRVHLVLYLVLAVALVRCLISICVVSSAADRILEIHIPTTGPVTVKDITPATQPDYIPEGTDLPSIIPPPATYNLKPGAVYVATKSFPDVIGSVKFTGGATVRYTGPESDGYLFYMGPAASFSSDGVVWENTNATKDSNKWGNLSFIHAGGVGTTLKNGTVRGFSNGVLIEQPSKNILIQNVAVEDLRSYFYYGGPGGDGVKIDSVTVYNSTVEAAFRNEGTKNVEVTNCVFEDEDNRPMGVGFDYAKSSFRPHVFDGLIVKRCKFALYLRNLDGSRTPIYDSAPIDLGPLGNPKDAPPAKTKGDRGTNARFEDCEIWGTVGLTHGLDGIVFQNCTVHTGDGVGVVSAGYSADYDRTVSGVSFLNCLFDSTSTTGKVLWVTQPGAKGMLFDSCVASYLNAVSEGNEDKMQVVVNDNVWPVTFKTCVLQKPVKYGWPGNAVARQAARYLSIEDFLKDFPGNTFAATTKAQVKSVGAGVRP
jgi:hypothetical protein